MQLCFVGLPSYSKYREYYGLSVAHKFEDLEDLTPKFKQLLSAVYADVRDIDLFTGGLTETWVNKRASFL